VAGSGNGNDKEGSLLVMMGRFRYPNILISVKKRLYVVQRPLPGPIPGWDGDFVIPGEMGLGGEIMRGMG